MSGRLTGKQGLQERTGVGQWSSPVVELVFQRVVLNTWNCSTKAPSRKAQPVEAVSAAALSWLYSGALAAAAAH